MLWALISTFPFEAIFSAFSTLSCKIFLAFCHHRPRTHVHYLTLNTSNIQERNGHLSHPIFSFTMIGSLTSISFYRKSNLHYLISQVLWVWSNTLATWVLILVCPFSLYLTSLLPSLPEVNKLHALAITVFSSHFRHVFSRWSCSWILTLCFSRNMKKKSNI